MKDRIGGTPENKTSVYYVTGGKKLRGEISPGGSKNAAFPILAASILLSEPIKLHNIPDIADIRCFVEILDSLGATTKYTGENSLEIDPRPINQVEVPARLGSKIRGSYYFLGSLLSRFGRANIPPPGGCKVGERPMDQHFVALSQIGFEFQEKDGGANGQKKANWNERRGTVNLPFPSRGATINTLLGASLSDGLEMEIVNYNQSPETQSLIDFLQKAGAKIIVSDGRLQIFGRSDLKLSEFTIIPDKIEAATLITAGLITRGEVTVQNIIVDHLEPFLDRITHAGFNCQILENSVKVSYRDKADLRAIDAIPGLEATDLDADFEPILASLLCTIPGDSIIEDAINPGRHAQFIPQLNKLGASIDQVSGTRAIVHGGTIFNSSEVVCNEIRGGAALLLATLSAQGNSIISNINQIERGYENLDKKLTRLGANITKVSK